MRSIVIAAICVVAASERSVDHHGQHEAPKSRNNGGETSLHKIPMEMLLEPEIVEKTPETEKSQRFRPGSTERPVYEAPVVKQKPAPRPPTPPPVEEEHMGGHRELQSAGLTCPPPLPPTPPDIPAFCPNYPDLEFLNSSMGYSGVPSIPFLTTSQYNADGTYVESGSIFEVTSECPVQFALGRSENIYYKIRVDPGHRLKYRWISSQSFIMFPDWHQVPYYIPSVGSSYNTYLWYGSLDMEYQFTPNYNTYRDFYHRTASWSFCGDGAAATNPVNCTAGLDPTINSGYVYFTQHAIASEFAAADSVLTGTVAFTTTPPTLTFIQPAQLSAIQDIYNHLCKPTQDHLPVWDLTEPANSVNRYWTRTFYSAGAYSGLMAADGIPKANPDYLYLSNYSTSGMEGDSDSTPFCHWLFSTRIPAGATTTADIMAMPPGLDAPGNCEQLDYVTCNANGDVTEIGTVAQAPEC